MMTGLGPGHPPTRITSAYLFLFIVIASAPPVMALSREDTSSIYATFEKITILNGQGRYDQSIEILSRIIKEYSNTDKVVRKAYNHLVYAMQQSRGLEAARVEARKALIRFPDLEVDPLANPLAINLIYDDLRAEIFGSLAILKPEGCRVFLDDEYIAVAPMVLNLVLARDYVLTLTLSGYHDSVMLLTIEPSGRHKYEFTMSRDRTRGWWLRRISAGLAAVTTTAFMVFDPSKTPTPESPLPDPPLPPTR